MPEKKCKTANTPNARPEIPYPDDLLSVFADLYKSGLDATRVMASGKGHNKIEVLRRRALNLAGKLRDSAIGTEAAELAAWREVRTLAEPPADSLAGALWLLAFVYRVVAWIDMGEFDDVDESAEEIENLKSALNTGLSAIQVEPLEARVRAAELLREDRKSVVKAPGPEPVQAIDGKRAKRL